MISSWEAYILHTLTQQLWVSPVTVVFTAGKGILCEMPSATYSSCVLNGHRFLTIIFLKLLLLLELFGNFNSFGGLRVTCSMPVTTWLIESFAFVVQQQCRHFSSTLDLN